MQFKDLSHFILPGQKHLGRMDPVQGRHQEMPGSALAEVGPGCHCYRHTGRGTEGGQNLSHLHFPFICVQVSSLDVDRLSAFPAWTQEGRDQRVPLAPIPGVELLGRGPSPPGLEKMLHRQVSR